MTAPVFKFTNSVAKLAEIIVAKREYAKTLTGIELARYEVDIAFTVEKHARLAAKAN